MTERTYQEDVRFFIENYLISIKKNLRTKKWVLIAEFKGEKYKFTQDFYGDVIAIAVNTILYNTI
uniref:Uncharacterized protein n=1 Tax=Dulem virus 53 TaxID=3145764 RepID=A0AAU8B4F9_9VIRU